MATNTITPEASDSAALFGQESISLRIDVIANSNLADIAISDGSAGLPWRDVRSCETSDLSVDGGGAKGQANMFGRGAYEQVAF
jgi:hypothetical protein